MSIPAPLFSELNLVIVIRALRGAVWGWIGHLGEPLGVLVDRRLAAVCARMERLMARFAARRLLPWAPRVPKVVPKVLPVVVAGVSGAKAAAAAAARIWPREFGWLLEIKRHDAALYSQQLEAILARPEMVALLIAAPQARRILTPVCRMLGISTSMLRPRAASEVAPAQVVRKRVRAKRPPVDWGRIPLPRGMLSWARREGFGKVPPG